MPYGDTPTESDEPSDIDRRTIIKSAGAAAATGALGALAGCSGDGGNATETTGGGDTGDDGSSNGGNDSSQQESVTVTHWTNYPTANSNAREEFPKSLRNFEEMNDGKIKVDMQPVTPGSMRDKIRSAIAADNAPDISIGGSLGPTLLDDGVTIDHASYAEESNYPDKTIDLCTVGATYRDKWYSTGVDTTGAYTQAIRPKFFKEIGIENPEEELATWTDVRRAYDKIDEQFDNTYAHEVTGAPNDLEVYWSEAHTSYQDGEDPWLDVTDQGSYDDPYVKIGQEGRTDAMIKNNIDMAESYSSPEAAQRTDEEIPSLMFTDRVASFHYGLGGFNRYQEVDPDVEFGWDGDVYEKPMPKVDPNFGEEYGFDGIAGKEGSHGGNASNVGGRMIFDSSDVKEEAWALENYIKTHEDSIIPLSTQYYPRPPVWQPALTEVRNEHMQELPQVYQAAVKALEEYPANYYGAGSKWDIPKVDQIRWQDINETISASIAGEHDTEETPGIIRENVKSTLASI